MLEKMRGHSNYVLSSSCDIPPQTRIENVDAFSKEQASKLIRFKKCRMALFYGKNQERQASIYEQKGRVLLMVKIGF